MTTATKQTWFEAAFEILQGKGAASLTIDTLATSLNVTKGSFYHHFKNYQDFKQNLLGFLENVGTSDVIAKVEAVELPLQKLDRLMNLTLLGRPGLEVAIRAWALQDETVRGYQARIDERRIAYLHQLLADIADEPQATLMAQLFYTVFVGNQQILAPVELSALYNEIKQLYQLSNRH